jgi:hypothetical protein
MRPVPRRGLVAQEGSFGGVATLVGAGANGEIPEVSKQSGVWIKPLRFQGLLDSIPIISL